MMQGYSIFILSSVPQFGQWITPSFGASNNSDTDTPKAEAIFTSVSTVGFPLIARDNAPSLIPIFAASSFAVIPLAFIISFIRNIFSYN
nr:MAG TPA: hypothetical protein [Caudoviricetes sp.]